jgi:hypothetical protein
MKYRCLQRINYPLFLKVVKMNTKSMQVQFGITPIVTSYFMVIIPNAPPSSMMDSITNLKVKTTEGEGVGARFVAHSTSRVEGHVGALRWD